jgi:TRAP-type mannitol/chloroaromatic compound transport system permease small subunit
MKWLRLTVKAIDFSSDAVAKYVCWVILALMVLTFYDVVMRYSFNSPTIWVYELVGLVFGPLWLMVGAYLLTHDEHVRMDIFWRRLSPRNQAIVDLITYTLFFFYSILIVVYGWDYFMKSFIRQDHLSMTMWKPLVWPFKLFLPVGVGFMVLAGIAKYIRDLYMAITGRRLE